MPATAGGSAVATNAPRSSSAKSKDFEFGFLAKNRNKSKYAGADLQRWTKRYRVNLHELENFVTLVRRYAAQA
jgi:hypothetical protein